MNLRNALTILALASASKAFANPSTPMARLFTCQSGKFGDLSLDAYTMPSAGQVVAIEGQGSVGSVAASIVSVDADHAMGGKVRFVFNLDQRSQVQFADDGVLKTVAIGSFVYNPADGRSPWSSEEPTRSLTFVNADGDGVVTAVNCVLSDTGLAALRAILGDAADIDGIH